MAIKGRLARRNKTFHNWKTRTFVLENSILRNFDDKGKLKEEFDLSVGKPTVKLFDDKKGLGSFGKYGMSIFGPHYRLILSASTAEQRVEWVRELVNAGCVIEEGSISLSSMTLLSGPSNSEKSTPMVYGPLREICTGLTFPPTFSDGSQLVGVGAHTFGLAVQDGHQAAVGFYVDAKQAEEELKEFVGYDLVDIASNEHFYTTLMEKPFRKCIIMSLKRRITRHSVEKILSTLLRPRMNGAFTALNELLRPIEKGLRKGDSMLFSLYPDGNVVFRYKGINQAPINSRELAKAIQGIFFDQNTLHPEVRCDLVARLPSLWGGSCEKSDSMVDIDELGDSDTEPEGEEYEQELMRRLSVQIQVAFGPIVEGRTLIQFPGTQAGGDMLIGVWSRFLDENRYLYALGLYVEPDGCGDVLLRYKGLSAGTLASDFTVFSKFMRGNFRKTFVLEFNPRLSVEEAVSAVVDPVAKRLGTQHKDIVKLRDVLDRHLQQLSKNERTMQSQPLRFSYSLLGNEITLAFLYQSEKLLSAELCEELQGIYLDANPLDSSSRLSLIERIPMLLDNADDHGAQTYKDEIEVLRENYARQRPGTKIKTGYLLKLHLKQHPMDSERWSKRWCRLDGTTLTNYAHKGSRRPRGAMNVLKTVVTEEIVRGDKRDHLPPLRFYEKGAIEYYEMKLYNPTTNEEVRFRTENHDEGQEWLMALKEASMAFTAVQSMDRDKHRLKKKILVEAQNGSLYHWLKADQKNMIIFNLLCTIYLLVWLLT